VTQSFKFVKIRQNSSKFVESACLCRANLICAIAILDECTSVDAEPKARVVFEHWRCDLTPRQ